MPKPRIVRSPPPLPFQDAPGGQCRACGVEILTKAGVPHKGRRWCADHQLDGKVVGSPRRARAALFMRDLGVCCDCGRDCTSYMQQQDGDVFVLQIGLCFKVRQTPIPLYRVQINREKALEWCDKAMTLSNRIAIWPIDLGEWHVDHAMPLHLVDRTDPEAWKQWTLENLRTRCTACHEEKTTKEAKVRAKIRRITGANKPKPKRQIQSRGFDKAKRPMRGKACG